MEAEAAWREAEREGAEMECEVGGWQVLNREGGTVEAGV